MPAYTHDTAPTRFLETGGTRFAYRRFGHEHGGRVPLVFFQHFRGDLDTFDPAITDGFASDREVVLFDNAGVGQSTGQARDTIAAIAADAESFLDALGLNQIDVLGHSMGGEWAQLVALHRPALVRRLVLVGTGPRGGEGMSAQRPSTAELFAKQYERQDEMWLATLLLPVAAQPGSWPQVPDPHPGPPGPGHAGIGRDRPGPPGRRRRMGAAGPGRLRLPREDQPAGPGRERQQRHRDRHRQLVHPSAAPARCPADPLPGLGPRGPLSVSGALPRAGAAVPGPLGTRASRNETHGEGHRAYRIRRPRGSAYRRPAPPRTGPGGSEDPGPCGGGQPDGSHVPRRRPGGTTGRYQSALRTRCRRSRRRGRGRSGDQWTAVCR